MSSSESRSPQDDIVELAPHRPVRGPLAGLRARLARGVRGPEAVGGFLRLVANGGRPFAPFDIDFDSLDNRDEAAVQRVLELLADPLAEYLQAEVRGLQHVQRSALYVANHSGGAIAPEIFLLGRALYRQFGLEALPYGLAHKLVGDVGMLGRVLIPIGAVAASHENAGRLFAAGRSVLVYPGGDQDAHRLSRRRHEVVFGERRGYIRLALRHGVPIVPVVAAGVHDVFRVYHEGRTVARWLRLDRSVRMTTFPLIFSLPWGFTFGLPLPYLPLPTTVRMQLLPPIEFERNGPEAAQDADYVEACHRHVHGQMQACMTRLARELDES